MLQQLALFNQRQNMPCDENLPKLSPSTLVLVTSSEILSEQGSAYKQDKYLSQSFQQSPCPSLREHVSPFSENRTKFSIQGLTSHNYWRIFNQKHHTHCSN